MGGAFYRINGSYRTRFLFVLLGVLALFAGASPGTPHNLAAFFSHGDFVYGFDAGGYAVAPRAERERQRGQPLLPAPDGPRVLAQAPAIVVAAATAGSVRPLLQAPVRFPHLDQRSFFSRGPPNPL